MLKELCANLIFFKKLNEIEIDIDDIYKRLLSGDTLLRWGDGEVSLIKGKSLYFQKHSDELGSEISQSLLYSKSNKLIVCSPHQFVNYSIISLLKKGKFRIWYKSRSFYILNFYMKKIHTGDAFGFRPESRFKYIDIIKKLALERDKVILISSSDDDIGKLSKIIGNNISIHHKLVQSKNSYEDRLDVITFLENNIIDNAVVFCSAGPLTKTLCNQNKYQLIDTGHFFDLYEEKC